MLKQLNEFESKLDTLLNYLAQVQEENRALRARTHALELENQSLIQRMEDAKARVDKLIENIQNPAN